MMHVLPASLDRSTTACLVLQVLLFKEASVWLPVSLASSSTAMNASVRISNSQACA